MTEKMPATPETADSGHDDIGADPSLLIVDDDAPFLRRLARAMETRGFQVETAESVAEGIARSKARPPKYAVVDLRLTDGNGVASRGRPRGAGGKPRIGARRVGDTPPPAAGGVGRGGRHYLTTPADADEIFSALTQRPGERAELPENPMSADRVRWEHIQRVYEMCERNVSETARRLNMHRRTLQRILAKRAPK